MKTLNTTLIAIAALLALSTAAPAQGIGEKIEVAVTSGDANGDGRLDADDPETMIKILFRGLPSTVSRRDLDHNRDGKFDIADVESALRDLDKAGERDAESHGEYAIVGDANDDGKVDIADLYTLGLWLTRGRRYEAPDEAVDVNHDGKVDITDLSELGKRVAG